MLIGLRRFALLPPSPPIPLVHARKHSRPIGEPVISSAYGGDSATKPNALCKWHRRMREGKNCNQLIVMSATIDQSIRAPLYCGLNLNARFVYVRACSYFTVANRRRIIILYLYRLPALLGPQSNRYKRVCVRPWTLCCTHIKRISIHLS